GLSRQYGGGSCEGAELSAGDRTPSPRTLGRRLQDTVGLCLPLRPRPRSSRDPFPSSKRKIHLTELMLETCPFPPGSDLARKWHLIKRHTAPIGSPSSSSASAAAAALLLDSRPSPEDEEERLRERRRLSIEEGVDPPPDAQIHSAEVPTLAGTLYKLGPKMAAGMGEGAGGGPKEGRGGVLAMGVAPRPPADCDSDSDSTTLCLQARRLKQRHTSGEGPPAGASSAGRGPWKVHTQIDYIHCLVPDLLEITGLPWYWGVMDRYQAEALLEGKPEGTFLLRDSAQEDYLFSVSFRRYGRSLHARVEQWNHNFSFDAHDPCVFHASTVTGLLEHYKDPGSCMFFEPLLTTPLHRTFPFSLQRLARATVCRRASYDAIGALPLPTALRDFLREYHYKQKVRVRWLEREPLQCK
ncbi:hypothetical protein AGOR_G00203450, partial [Albula goreensis]